MVQFQERPRTHSQPGRHDGHRRPQQQRAPAATSAHIDCDACPIAGTGCAGCMVALLGPVRLRLNHAERRAVAVLAEQGLVSQSEAEAAYAVPDLPDWMVEAGRLEVAPGEGLRAIS
ncbi:MAG: hypothetical protein Q4G67_01000 [Actinomycetia bacterium]|nr:hypothetical protein [Actinomycetes bacterium]